MHVSRNCYLGGEFNKFTDSLNLAKFPNLLFFKNPKSHLDELLLADHALDVSGRSDAAQNDAQQRHRVQGDRGRRLQNKKISFKSSAYLVYKTDDNRNIFCTLHCFRNVNPCKERRKEYPREP